jgi:uncharacterized delta-60 repeat protein
MPFLLSPRTRPLGIQIAGFALLVSLGATPCLRASTLPIDGFDPSPNSIVNTILVQPDGKILMGGYFTQLHPYGLPGSGHGYIARLNHDGSPDSTFSPNANGVVRVMALQPNGQIVIGGNFTGIQPTGGASQITRNYVARLNADGTLDSAFNPGVNGIVYAIAVQSNGQIVIGGSFTTVQPNGRGKSDNPEPRGAFQRRRLARLDVRSQHGQDRACAGPRSPTDRSSSAAGSQPLSPTGRGRRRRAAARPASTATARSTRVLIPSRTRASTHSSCCQPGKSSWEDSL